MKHYLLAFISILIALTNRAQEHSSITLKGTLRDESNQPVEGAVVSLLRSPDLQLLKTGFSETDGSYELSGLSADSVRLLVALPGFQTYTSETFLIGGSGVLQHPVIALKTEGKKLDEVTVVTKLPFVERKIDRTVVNPEALISNAGGTALDVLSKSPGIMVEENGDIKLKGKSGVMVYVDDKPTFLSGAALESYLKSLPAEAIKQIEIMTNPPAHYDAAGNSGIINIKTKRSKLRGINGNVSVNYAQGRYARTNDNAALSFSGKKLAIFSNLSYGIHNGFHDLTIQRRYKDEAGNTQSIFDQNTYMRRHSETFNGRIGADYYLNDRTTIGASLRGLQNSSDNTSFNKAVFLGPDYDLTSRVIADNGETSLFGNATANLNLRQQIDSLGQSITADLDYVTYSTRTRQSYKNDVWLPDGTNTYSDRQSGDLPSVIHIYAFKSDYVKPLKKNAKFDAGIKASFTQTDNEAIYTITQNDIERDNYDLSNHFKYDELISAAYLNYSKGFKRFDVQAGLRFESTQLQGRQLGNAMKPASEFNRDYNSLFPTLYLSYKLDTAANHLVNLSYGRRVNRPYYQDLNPFISPLDKYTFYEGNPYLRPTFANNVALAYSYKSFFTTTFSYNNTDNQIQETIEIREGIYYSRPGNIASSVQYNLSVEGSVPVEKWLTFNFYTEVQHALYRSRLYTETLDSKGTYWFVSGSTIFNLKKGWSAELSGQYITNFIDSQFWFGDFGFINVGAQKKILKDKGTLKFSLNDVLFSNRIRGRINNLRMTDANWFGPRDTRVASLTFSYRFGKVQNNKARHNSTGSETEQGRVKG